MVEIVNDTAVMLNWTTPENTFGSITVYIIMCQPEISVLPTISVSVSGSATSATVSGLENGARYNCSVAAQNDAGLLSEPSIPLRIRARVVCK